MTSDYIHGSGGGEERGGEKDSQKQADSPAFLLPLVSGIPLGEDMGKYGRVAIVLSALALLAAASDASPVSYMGKTEEKRQRPWALDNDDEEEEVSDDDDDGERFPR